MSKFKSIVANSINKTFMIHTSTGLIFVTGDSGYKALMFFESKDVNNIYTEDQLVYMVSILTAFQYHWLENRSNFDAYGPKHNAVQKYIFDNYHQLCTKSKSSLLDDMYQIFK